GEGEAAAGAALGVGALEDGHMIVKISAGQSQDGADPGGPVGSVGLEAPDLQSLAEGLARQKPVPDGVGLVAVGDNEGVIQAADRVVDDEAGVRHLALIPGPGADAVLRGAQGP